MNSKGYKSLIQLNIYRRTIVAYVLKFNNEAMEQISDIMNKCHMSHINVAYQLYQNKLLALNKERLRMYLDSVYPTISVKGLQMIIKN